jgi:hypothetical protein
VSNAGCLPTISGTKIAFNVPILLNHSNFKGLDEVSVMFVDIQNEARRVEVFVIIFDNFMLLMILAMLWPVNAAIVEPVSFLSSLLRFCQTART